MQRRTQGEILQYFTTARNERAYSKSDGEEGKEAIVVVVVFPVLKVDIYL